MLTTAIFDLDGVLVDTADLHFEAWQFIARKNDLYFDKAINEQLKGVSRRKSFDIILSENNREMSEEIIEINLIQKNSHYLELIKGLKESDLLPGAKELLELFKEKGIAIALGSASKNAQTILNKTGIEHYFTAIVDGNCVAKAKPDPEVFLKGAELTKAAAENCMVFEDAFSGVEAAVSAGMRVVGVGDKEQLHKADLVVPDLKDQHVKTFIEACIK